MLFSKLALLATAASAAAIKRQTVGPNPEYQVTDFNAQHDDNSPNQTISFTISSTNTGLNPTSCSATQACPDTNTYLCKLDSTSCSNYDVSFTFNRDDDSHLWYLGIGYQAESELYSDRYSFTEEEDTFFQYTSGGATYEKIVVPGGAFNFTG